MKNFLIILAFFPLSIFAQQSVLSSFNGYGDIVNVIDVDPTDSLFTIEINNFYGSPRFQPFGPWIAQDVQVGMVMWVDCARFVITNVNSASFSTMSIDVKVPSVDWNLGVATPLPNSRCAVVFEDQYLLTALPAPADGNSGALSGINNTLFACMLNHYSQALLVTKNSVNEITDYVAGLDTIPSEAPGPNIGETWRNSVGQLFYSNGTQWLTDKEVKFSNASLEGLPSYLYKLGIDTLGQDTLYISNNGIFRRFQSGLVYKEGYGINIFATDSIEVDTNQIATQNDLTPFISGTGANGQVTFWTGLKTQSGDNGLFWDNTNKRLGVGLTSPSRTLDVFGDFNIRSANTNNANFTITTNTFGATATVTGGSANTRIFYFSPGGGDTRFVTPGSNTELSLWDATATQRIALSSSFGSFITNNLTIGATGQTGRLHVRGSGNTTGTWTAQFHNSGGNNNALMVRDDGNIGLSTNAPARTLHVAGTMRLTGNAGTATEALGRDASGDISGVPFSTVISSGGGVFGSGTTDKAAFWSSSNTINAASWITRTTNQSQNALTLDGSILINQPYDGTDYRFYSLRAVRGSNDFRIVMPASTGTDVVSFQSLNSSNPEKNAFSFLNPFAWSPDANNQTHNFISIREVPRFSTFTGGTWRGLNYSNTYNELTQSGNVVVNNIGISGGATAGSIINTTGVNIDFGFGQTGATGITRGVRVSGIATLTDFRGYEVVGATGLNGIGFYQTGTLHNRFLGSLNVGQDAVPNARIRVVGAAATASTFGLIVTNSDTTTANATLVVRDDKRVGIGTNAPTDQLHTTGSVRLQNYPNTLNSTGNPVNVLSTSSTGVVESHPISEVISSAGGITGSGVSGRVAFWTGTSTQSSNANFVWDNTNSRLGIKRAAPSFELDVNGGGRFLGGSADSGVRIDGGPNSFFRMNAGVSVAFFSHNYQPFSPASQDNTAIPSWFWRFGGGAGADFFDISRSPAGSTTMTSYFRLDGAGNLGINQSTPLARLHVAGSSALGTDRAVLVTDNATTPLNLFEIRNNGDIYFNDYPNTLNTTGNPVNVLSTGTDGLLQSHPISEVISSAGGVTGSGVAGQVAYWSGTQTQTGSSSLVYNDTQKSLTLSNSTQSGVPRGWIMQQTTGDGAGNSFIMQKSRAGVITSGTDIGTWDSEGFDGSAYQKAARIAFTATGTIGSGIVPGTISFLTANSSGTLTARTTVNHLGELNHFGNVGIGSLGSPAASLHVRSSGASSTTWTAQFHNSAGNNNALMIRDDGRVSFGTASPSKPFHVSGESYFASALQLEAGLKDNRDNVFLSQSLNSVTANREIVLGNGTYAKIRMHTKGFYIGASFPASESLFYVDGGTGTSILDRQGIYMRPTQPATGGNTAGGDVVIELPNGTGTGRKGAVLIGSATATGPSAILELNSTDRGFLPPRMTTTERDAIASPAAGLTIYNTTVGVMQHYNGSTWTDERDNTIGLSGLGITNYLAQYNSSNTLDTTGIIWTGGRMGIGTATPSATFDVVGTVDFQNPTTAFDGPTLGAELLTTGTGTNWTGTGFATGYTHTVGSTVALTSSFTPVAANYYVVVVTVSGRTAGSISFTFGNNTGSTISTNTTQTNYWLGGSTSALIITPTTDFNGTVVASVKLITASSPQFTGRISSGTLVYEERLSSTNIIQGLRAGQNNITGSNNIFQGSEAGRYNTTGINNVFQGLEAGKFTTTGSNNIFQSTYAGLNNTTGSNNIFQGTEAGRLNTTGSWNIFQGTNAGYNNVDGNYNIFQGLNSGYSSTSSTDNIFQGQSSGRNNTTGSYNIFSGGFAGFTNSTGSHNIFMGYEAGRLNTTGGGNIFLGRQTGYSTTTGLNNTFVGNQAGNKHTNSNFNSIFGGLAGFELISASNNTYVGYNAARENRRGGANTILGAGAGRYFGTSTSVDTSINNSILIGFDTRARNGNETNQIVIGYEGRGLGSNTTRIGNTSTIQTHLDGRLTIGNTFYDSRVAARIVGADASTSNYSLVVTDSDGATSTTVDPNFVVRNDGLVGIGTYSPGAKLQINGSGNTNATRSFTLRNSTDLLLDVTDDGLFNFGANSGQIRMTGTNGALNNAGENLTFLARGTSINDFGTGHFNFTGNTLAATSGNGTFVSIYRQFAPSSGSAQYFYLNISPVINQTGTANGATAGINVAPSLTSAADWRSIQWGNSSGWGLYGLGTAPNYLAGALGIGAAVDGTSGYNLRVTKPFNTVATARGIISDASIGTGPTTVTYFGASGNAGATANVTNLFYYNANQSSFASGSVIGTQIGYNVGEEMVGATNNYGFMGRLPSGANRWNLYMSGTANNYLAGSLGIGSTSPARLLHVQGEARISDLTTDTPTRIVGADGDGDLGEITLGSGLSITSGVLNTSSTLNTGSGTTNYVTKWTGTNTIGNSQIFDDGTNVGIGTTTMSHKLTVNGDISLTTNNTSLFGKSTGGSNLSMFKIDGSNNLQFGSVFNGANALYYTATDHVFYNYPSSTVTQTAIIKQNGNMGIGVNNPSARLHVVGVGTTTGYGLIVTDVNNTTATASLVVQDNGRVGIGTNAPDTRLDIRGTTANNTASSFRVRNSTPTTLFEVRNDGVVFLGPWTLWYPFNNATGVATPVPDGKLMRLSWGASGATENGYGIFASNAQITNRDYTSGDGGGLRLGEGYAPTSGNGEYNFLYMSGTINQTGGANGTTRGIFLAPTLTSAANYRAIQWNNSTGFGLYGEGTAPNRLNGILSLPSTSEASPGLQFNSNSAVGLYSSDVNNIGLVSGDRKQLLLEKAATNLLLQSEDISTTWIKLGGTSGTTLTTNVATAPNGTMTADKIVCNFNLGYGIRQTLIGTFLAGRTYTFSVWARTDSTNILSLDINDATASIKKVALTNNWIRYSTTFTFTSNTTNPFVDITFDATLQNALNKHMYVWGMQFEESLNPTMYIPTTTASASKLSGFYFVDSTTVEMSIIDRKVGINNSNPVKSLHVTGEVRISDLDNGVATRIVGATADGDLDELTLGSGLSITSGTISVTNPISASEVFIESSTATTIDLDANTGVVKDVNGTNASFTLPTDLSRLNVYKNGIRLARTGSATTRDFSVNTGTNEITFTTALLSTDRIVIVKI